MYTIHKRKVRTHVKPIFEVRLNGRSMEIFASKKEANAYIDSNKKE